MWRALRLQTGNSGDARHMLRNTVGLGDTGAPAVFLTALLRNVFMVQADQVAAPGVIQQGDGVIAAVGGWVITGAADIYDYLEQFSPPAGRHLTIDLDGIEIMDTAGAWLLYRTAKRLEGQGVEIVFQGGSAEYLALLEQAQANDAPCEIEPHHLHSVLALFAELGEGTIRALSGGRVAVGFLGAVIGGLGRTIRNPRRFRLTATVHQIEIVGLNALPIIGLISFLIGVVIAFQGAFQLRLFGAEIFTVNLVAVSVLREFGILLAAIMVAGRSGSSFAAEIGSMKLNEEVDAMRALALDPIDILVIPRVVALTLMMPILTFYADMFGLFGGLMISWTTLDISPLQFIERAHGAVAGWDMGVGLIKAPIFGLIIALTGCYEGLMTEGSAESVGYRTTKSVVEAIFLIIVLDAFFAIFFTEIGL